MSVNDFGVKSHSFRLHHLRHRRSSSRSSSQQAYVVQHFCRLHHPTIKQHNKNPDTHNSPRWLPISTSSSDSSSASTIGRLPSPRDWPLLWKISSIRSNHHVEQTRARSDYKTPHGNTRTISATSSLQNLHPICWIIFACYVRYAPHSATGV